MIKYDVGEMIQTQDDMWIIIKAEIENKMPWEQEYTVIGQKSKTIKKVSLFNLTHRCI